jgi:tetratricopeptide (TPR) repeat protein
MAGIGKTTFALHAAHRLSGSFPGGQFFLPLHAHTAGQRPVDPADALASLLLTAGVGAQQIPPGLEARAAWWRDFAAGKKILLLLDDAAGHEQVRPLLPGTAGSLVLVTSRRRLTALQAAAVISLDTLPPGEAATLLARLAARPAIRAGDAAVRDITRLCGYLPLAIGMLASHLRHHPARTGTGLAAELAAARRAGDRLGEAYTLCTLGVVQQLTGDYPAAAASHQQALTLFADLGNRLGQAEALNRLGELATRTADTPQARKHHTQALAIARDLSAAPEKARALEGLGHSHLQDGHPGQAAAHLQQALTIYQRIGAPAARRVQQTIQNHRLRVRVASGPRRRARFG